MPRIFDARDGRVWRKTYQGSDTEIFINLTAVRHELDGADERIGSMMWLEAIVREGRKPTSHGYSWAEIECFLSI